MCGGLHFKRTLLSYSKSEAPLSPQVYSPSISSAPSLGGIKPAKTFSSAILRIYALFCYVSNSDATLPIQSVKTVYQCHNKVIVATKWRTLHGETIYFMKYRTYNSKNKLKILFYYIVTEPERSSIKIILLTDL